MMKILNNKMSKMEAEARLNRLLEQRREASRRFYQNHKEKLATYYKKYVRETGYYKHKVTCECGKIVSRGSMSSHKKSKFHETFVNAAAEAPAPAELR